MNQKKKKLYKNMPLLLPPAIDCVTTATCNFFPKVDFCQARSNVHDTDTAVIRANNFRCLLLWLLYLFFRFYCDYYFSWSIGSSSMISVAHVVSFCVISGSNFTVQLLLYRFF